MTRVASDAIDTGIEMIQVRRQAIDELQAARRKLEGNIVEVGLHSNPIFVSLPLCKAHDLFAAASVICLRAILCLDMQLRHLQAPSLSGSLHPDCPAKIPP